MSRKLAQWCLTVLIKKPESCWPWQQQWDFRAASSSKRSSSEAAGGLEAWRGPICSVRSSVFTGTVLDPPRLFPDCQHEQDLTYNLARDFTTQLLSWLRVPKCCWLCAAALLPVMCRGAFGVNHRVFQAKLPLFFFGETHALGKAQRQCPSLQRCRGLGAGTAAWCGLGSWRGHWTKAGPGPGPSPALSGSACSWTLGCGSKTFRCQEDLGGPERIKPIAGRGGSGLHRARTPRVQPGLCEPRGPAMGPSWQQIRGRGPPDDGAVRARHRRCPPRGGGGGEGPGPARRRPGPVPPAPGAAPSPRQPPAPPRGGLVSNAPARREAARREEGAGARASGAGGQAVPGRAGRAAPRARGRRRRARMRSGGGGRRRGGYFAASPALGAAVARARGALWE